MDGIRHRERFAEIEALMDSYFRCHIAPVMSKTRTYLTEKQGEEMMEYSTSPGGILSLMASSMQPLGRPVSGAQGDGRMELEDHRGLYRNVQGGDRRLGGDAAGPRLHGRTVARGRRAGGGPRALRRTVAGAGLRPGLCVRGLPRRATDDRPAGRGTDAQVVVRIHHPQGGPNRACWG